MLRDLLRESWVALRHNRRSAALTMLGMAWGIATVVLLLAYGNGFGAAIANIFASFGTKTIVVVPGRTSMQAGGQKAGAPVQFTMDDVDLLTTNVPQITRITPEIDKTCNIQFETRSFNFPVSGDYANVVSIRVLEPDDGRFFGPEEEAQRARVAVLGSEAKEKLFSGRNALGESIRIDGIAFEVIGILGPKMQEGDNDINRMIYIPFSTMSELRNTHYIETMWLSFEVNDYLGVENSVRQVMAIQHKFDPADRRAVRIYNFMDQLHQFQIITFGLKILLTFIGSLTLGIGGVGLMNIMLVSVMQRTREVGMLKALGSRSRDILFQFLAEALIISFMGGILGVIIAYAIALSAGRITFYSALAQHAEAGDIRLLIDPATLVIATLILTAVGLISGLVPAIRASRLDPIEALRYE
jgi:putative ABC transport system permease protein